MGQQQSASLRRNSKKGSDKQLLLTNYAHDELSKSKKGSTRKNKKSSSKHGTENYQEDMNMNQSSKVATLNAKRSNSKLNLNKDKKKCTQEEDNVKCDQAKDSIPAHDSTSVPISSTSPKLPPRDTKVKIDISHLDQLKKNEASSSPRKFSDNSTMASKMFDQSTVGGTVAYTVASDANLSYNSHGFDRLIQKLDSPTKMFNIDEDMSVNNTSPTRPEQKDEINDNYNKEKNKEHVSLQGISGMTDRGKAVEKTKMLTKHDSSTSKTRKRSDSMSEASQNNFEFESNTKQDTNNHVPSYITRNASIDSSSIVDDDEEEEKTQRPLLTNSKSKASHDSTTIDYEEKSLSQKNDTTIFHNSHSDEDEDTPDPDPETKPIQSKKHNKKKKNKEPTKDDIDDVVQLYYQSYLDDERDRRLQEVMKAEPPPTPPPRTKGDSGKKERKHKIKFQQAESYSTQSTSYDDEIEKKERTKSISFDSYASSSASESLFKSKGREGASSDNPVDSTKKIRSEKSGKRTDDVTASIEDYYQTYIKDSSETSKIHKHKTGNVNNDSAEMNKSKQSTNYQYYKRMRSRSRTRAESILRGQRDSESKLNDPKDEPKKHDSSSPYLNRMRSRSRSRARGESVVRRVENENPVPSTDAAEDVSNHYAYTRPQQRRMRSVSRIRGESVIRRGKEHEEDMSRKASETCLSKEKSDEKDYSHQSRRRMRSLSQRREDAATRRAKEEIRIDTTVVDSPEETTANKKDYGYSYNRMRSLSRPREESVIRKDEDTKVKPSEMDSPKDYTADRKDYGYGYSRRMRSLSRPRGELVVRKTDYTKVAEPTKDTSDKQQTRPASRPRAESVARKIDEYTKLFSKELDTPKPTSNKQDYISPYNRRMRSISRPREESVVRKDDDTKNIASKVDTSKGLSNGTNDFISPYHRRMRSISRTRKVSPVETDRKANSINIQSSEEDKSYVAPYKSTPTANSRQERRRLRSQSPSPFMKNNDYQENVSMNSNSEANNIQDATKKDVESSYLNPSERRRNLRSASPLYNRLNAKKVESKPSEDARPQLRQGESNRSVCELSVCNKADEMIARLKSLSSNKVPPTITGR